MGGGPRRRGAKLGLAVVGVLVGLGVAELGLQLTSVLYRGALDRQARHRLADEGVFRIACVGESTTRGIGDNSWPQALADRLRTRSAGRLDVDVVNLGQPGSHSGQLAANIDAWLDLYQPDVVITMIGVNDDLNLLVSETPTEIRRRTLLDRSRLWRFVRLSWRMLTAAVPAATPAVVDPATTSPVAGDDEARRAAAAARLVEEVDRLDAALAGQSDEPALLARLYDAVAAIGDTDRRLEVLSRLVEVETGPAAVGHALELAALLRDDRDDEAAAIAVYEHVLVLDPDNREALVRLGDIFRQREPRRALAVLERAFERYPTYHLSGLWLADVLRSQGRAERADEVQAATVACFEEALRAHPDDLELYRQYALFYGTGGHPEARVDVLRRALEVFPGDEGLRREVGNLLFDLNRYAAALHEFEWLARQPVYADRLAAAGSVKLLAASLLLEHKGAGKVAAFLTATGYHLPVVNPATQQNYGAIADAIRRRGIRHIAMQYPTLPLATLEATLEYRDDVGYVDNGPAFAAALAAAPYEALFSDRFAGSFGHLTERGNELIVDNLLPALEPLLPPPG